MTPKEKAIEIYGKMYKCYDANGFCTMDRTMAKKCAIITIDEMIIQNGELYLNGMDGEYYRTKNAFLFDVKTELEKL